MREILLSFLVGVVSSLCTTLIIWYVLRLRLERSVRILHGKYRFDHHKNPVEGKLVDFSPIGGGKVKAFVTT